jgi:hypothetical protein
MVLTYIKFRVLGELWKYRIVAPYSGGTYKILFCPILLSTMLLCPESETHQRFLGVSKLLSVIPTNKLPHSRPTFIAVLTVNRTLFL